MIDVRQQGAAGDGTTVDTVALQAAIDACGRAGGGRVVLPAGRYLSATLRLASGVELHLAEGARLVGVPDPAAYTGPADDPTNRWLHALIIGEDVADVAITGPGTVDGNNVRDPRGEERMRGPHTVLLRRCRNVRLADVTFRDSANYAFLFYATEGVRVEDVTFEGGWDGVHYRELDGVWNRDVTLRRCRFYTGDDSIAGSGVEDCVIDECVINSSCNGVRLIGPARRWTMTNCRFFGPGRFPHITQDRHNMLVGLNLQPSAWDARPGPLEDVVVRDVVMTDVLAAFHVVTHAGNTAERLTFERVSATVTGDQHASSVEAWGERTFADVTFRDVAIAYPGGASTAATERPIHQPGVGSRPLPVWGFYARHLASLTLDRVALTAQTPDARPAFRADDVARLRLHHLAVTPPPAEVEAVQLNAVEQLEREDGPKEPAAPRLVGLAAEAVG